MVPPPMGMNTMMPPMMPGMMGGPGGQMGGGPRSAPPPAPPPADSKMAKYQKLVRRKQKDNANVVFVGGLRKTTEEDRVCAHFAKFGQVEHVDIKRQADGTSRGFAFIKFADVEAVEKVIDAHAKHMIDNKWVEVKRHDGMAACAGMASSLAKKAEEEAPPPKEETHEENAEQWAEQYLQLASQMAPQEGGGGGGGGPGASANSANREMALDMVKKIGVDTSMVENIVKDPRKMAQSFGMDFDKMSNMMGLEPNKMIGMLNNIICDPTALMSSVMMGSMMMMNPMMMMMMSGGNMGGMNMDPSSMDPSKMDPSKMMGMMGNMDPSKFMGMMGGATAPGAAAGGGAAGGAEPPKALPEIGDSSASNHEPERRRQRSPSRSRSASPGQGGQEKDPQDGTLSFMLGGSSSKDKDGPHDAARKAAASAAAAAFLQTASKVAETSRDAARDAATARAAAPVVMEFNQHRPERPKVDESGPWQAPGSKLWVPEPSAQQEPEHNGSSARASSPGRRGRSRSRRRAPPRSPSPNRKRRGGGWDEEKAAAAAAAAAAAKAVVPASQPAQVASSTLAQPSRPAMPPGAHPQSRPMGGPMNRFGVAEATPEALAAAIYRAQQVEAAGLESIRSTGQIPRGPPDLPTGTEVIEQKCVAYLIGKGGQALAAINAAAGVSIQIDQSTKTMGWSMANIYGTEEGSAKAKMILRQKVSEYRPLRG